MLGNITIRYICDTQHLNIICIISYFYIFPFLEHYFHYNIYSIILIILNRTSGPFRCLIIDTNNTFSFLRPINRDYSRLLFDYITYSAKNMGEHCVFVIYQHRGKCNSLMFTLLLFCLSRQIPLDPHVVYCLHIYNTFVVLMTDKPRLCTVDILLHHILRQQYGHTLRLRHPPTQR